MKKVLGLLLVLVFTVGLTSCERVAPNYYGVLMENYGKNGKDDYAKQQGRVITMSPGTELFQVPAWEQRGQFTDDEGQDRVLQVKAADNTAFTSKPLYSYKVMENRVVDVVFQNSRLGSGDDFMTALQDNVLEPRIYDIIKEASRSYTTEELMANGGSLKFEQYVQDIVTKEFEKSGLQLVSFSLNLDFSNKVKAKIDSRNEVNTNISVLNQQIEEQKKKNELLTLQAIGNKITSEGITPQILQTQAIKKWNGKLPTTYSGSSLPFVKTVN
jgi:hypothetical protein